MCSLCSSFQSHKLQTRGSPFVSKHFDHSALSLSKTILQKRVKRATVGNCDTWERKDGALMKVFSVVKHQTCLFVLSFCALLVVYSSWSSALSRWMQFVSVDFCQVSFYELSSSKKDVFEMQLCKFKMQQQINFII